MTLYQLALILMVDFQIILLLKKILSKIPHIRYKSKTKLKYASLTESLACVINGLEITNFKNQNIVIIGAGYMGLLFVALSKIKKQKYFYNRF